MSNHQYLTHNYIYLSRMRYALKETFAGEDYGLTHDDKAEGIRQITGKMNAIGALLGHDPIELEKEYQ